MTDHNHMRYQDAGPTPLQWLLHEIERTPGASVSKERIRTILAGMIGTRIFLTHRDLRMPVVRKLARALIDAGMSCVDATRQLAGSTGLSISQARRYVVCAMNERAIEAAAARQLGLFQGDTDGRRPS